MTRTVRAAVDADVDADNPTGALGRYGRAGFVVQGRFDEMLLRD